MNKYLAIALVVFLAACGSGGDDLASKKKTLEEKKTALDQLKTEIATLEEEIAAVEDTLNGGEKKETGVLVSIKTLEPESFKHFFEVNGTVAAAQDIMVSPETGGLIDKVFVKEGDRVKQGDKIAKLNTSVLEKNIAELKTSLTLATTVFERQKRLWDQKIGSEIQFLEAKNNKEALENKLATVNEQLQMATVVAPTSGVIDRVIQKEGEMGAPGMPIVQLVNPKSLEIKADVSEAYAATVKKGDVVELSFPNFNKELKAPIDRVSSAINPGNRTFNVQVNLNNPDEYIKPNALAVLRITDYKTDEALVVPSRIVHKDMRGEYVYVVADQDGKQVSNKTYIKTGQSSSGVTEIVEGLKAGDKVIVQGYTSVANGDEVLVKQGEVAKAEQE